MTNVPQRYVPKHLSQKDKKKQRDELRKSRRKYKKGTYHTRKKMHSFKSKPSRHILKAREMYNIENIKPTLQLAKATKCSLRGLKKCSKKAKVHISPAAADQTKHRTHGDMPDWPAQ